MFAAIQSGKSFCSALFFICAFSAHGQNYQRFWADGLLTWDDFQTRTSLEQSSELKYFIGYKPERVTVDDTIYLRPKARAYMDKSTSWVNPAFLNNEYLLYNQVIFDLLERYRRRLQESLYFSTSTYDLERRFNEIYIDTQTQMNRLRRETRGGQDAAEVEAWKKRLDGELERGEPFVPEWHLRNLGYAMQFGLGSGTLTGGLGDRFHSPFYLVFGFDFSFQRHTLFLLGSLGFTVVKKDFTFKDELWGRNESADLAIADISYGYVVTDGAKWKLTPFAGLGFTEFSVRGRPEAEVLNLMVALGPIAGLAADYKLRKRLNLIPNLYFGSKEYTETLLRLRLYSTYGNYGDGISGLTINVKVGIGVFGRLVKLTPPQEGN